MRHLKLIPHNYNQIFEDPANFDSEIFMLKLRIFAFVKHFRIG